MSRSPRKPSSRGAPRAKPPGSPAIDPDAVEVGAVDEEAGDDEVGESEALDPELALEADFDDEDDDGDSSSSVSSELSGALPVVAPESPSSELVPHDPLSRYLAEIGRYPLLDRSDELRLALAAHDGDPVAAQQLVLANLRLVVKIARDYRRVWTNLLDLIQEGNIGLVQGVKRFDPERGVKLSTYAAYWIRAYILKYLIDNIRMVRVGSSRAERKLFFRLNRAKRELERAGFKPEPKLIAEKLDVKESDVLSIEARLGQSDLSMDAPARRDDPGSASFGDFVTAETTAPDEAVANAGMLAAFREQVERFATQLDERESVILNERVLAEDGRTLQEIGDQFGLTRERVRQIEKQIVDRLREYLSENLVDFEYWAPDS